MTWSNSQDMIPGLLLKVKVRQSIGAQNRPARHRVDTVLRVENSAAHDEDVLSAYSSPMV